MQQQRKGGGGGTEQQQRAEIVLEGEIKPEAKLEGIRGDESLFVFEWTMPFD